MIDDRKPMMDLGDSTSEVAANARNLSPIVPRGSISGRALLERKVVHVHDVHADPEYTMMGWTAPDGIIVPDW